jgi:glycosyltransferase involved in cell wall biosynthesis
MRDRAGKLKVTVAVLTRDRPKMLADLLTSLSKLDDPDHCELAYLVVENNQSKCQEALVRAFGPKFTTGSIHYVLETKLGIASARNRAAKEAINLDADLLVFVDDDEIVPPEWLANLVGAYRKSSAVLLGGPLRAAPLSENCTWLEKLMHKNISRRYCRNEKRAARRASLNDTPGVTIVTNNWIGQVDIFTNHKISFNENLNWSGGEDTQFYSDVRSLGLRTGWVSNAPVYETIPKDRLTFGYQFKRAKDQSNTSFKRKLSKKPSAIYTLPVSVALKTIGLLGLLFLMPLTLSTNFLTFCRTAGWIAGRISAALGATADHYRTVTGE